MADRPRNAPEFLKRCEEDPAYLDRVVKDWERCAWRFRRQCLGRPDSFIGRDFDVDLKEFARLTHLGCLLAESLVNIEWQPLHDAYVGLKDRSNYPDPRKPTLLFFAAREVLQKIELKLEYRRLARPQSADNLKKFPPDRPDLVDLGLRIKKNFSLPKGKRRSIHKIAVKLCRGDEKKARALERALRRPEYRHLRGG